MDVPLKTSIHARNRQMMKRYTGGLKEESLLFLLIPTD